MGEYQSDSFENLDLEDRKILDWSLPADYSFQHITALRDFHINENTSLESGKPADYSFRRASTIKAMAVEAARSVRTGSVPERGTAKKKLLTRSLWLNNNKLKSIQNLEEVVESVLEVPSQLSWADFSFNYIKEIDECILKYPNLKIIYFHGNCISKITELLKLRKLKKLKTVTFHGNPISNIPLYRASIICILPQILNLDFTPVIKNEKLIPPPPDILKIVREYEAKGK